MTQAQFYQNRIDSILDQQKMLSRICKAKSAIEIAEIVEEESARITKEAGELKSAFDTYNKEHETTTES